ncbi:MAG TPA: hypothetical protein DCZ51_10510 [Bacteroidales bacterium]|nr:hypothetical protein [Bacteroidales bacterium]
MKTYRFRSYLFIAVLIFFIISSCKKEMRVITSTVFCTHQVVLDQQGKIVPWYSPAENAYDHFLSLRWNFVMTRVPDSPGPDPRSRYPQYFFYCAFRVRNDSIVPDAWMNDIGEKIPNWFESARLYYAYSGDSSAMNVVRKLIDYTLDHGTSSPDYEWPRFPYTTANAGDTLFRGFSDHPVMVCDEIQVDHAGEMGLTYFRMYQFTGENRYLEAALNVADVLAKNARTGTATESVWPYRVVMSDGKVIAPYGANWTGCYMLFDNLIRTGIGNVTGYIQARDKARDFILQFPMKTGYWTDGHTDTDINSNTYKSNLSASNATLCMFDYPELNPDRETDIPKLIRWTEDNFIFRSRPGEPSEMWGANIVGEQDTFLVKMDYQTARYAAACARWFSISGDDSYKEKAYRALNWVTYCNDSTGLAFESPVSKGISSWWSDCYGECPRMFYQAFAGVPEWAPPRENHILYSEGMLRKVQYAEKQVRYTALSGNGTEYLRLSFKPEKVTINGQEIEMHDLLMPDSYLINKLGNGDYALTIKHSEPCDILISGL